MMVQATLLVPNAIVFLYDLTSNNVLIPEYIDNALVAANETCISVGTQSDVDGEVTLKLSGQLDGSDKELCEQVFDGFVETPNKNLVISTSEEEGILQIYVKSEKTHVSVWVDDADFPSLVLVEAE